MAAPALHRYLTTLVVVVPKAQEAAFLATYEGLADDSVSYGPEGNREPVVSFMLHSNNLQNTRVFVSTVRVRVRVTLTRVFVSTPKVAERCNLNLLKPGWFVSEQVRR